MRAYCAVLLAAAAAAACATDEDCSLNGKCSSSGPGAQCQCNPGWTGGTCATFNFGPAAAAVKGGAYGYAPNVTSWGGNPILRSGKYHLFVTEIVDGCFLKMWGTDSSVTHAVADTPEGPYTKNGTALLPEAHNPQTVELPDGSLAMFHIGSATNSSRQPCVSDAEPETEPAPRSDVDVVHVAPDVHGPWSPVVLPFSCNNPAPMVHPNGTLFVLCNEGRKVLHAAPSIKGPWAKVTTLPGPPPGMGVWEDPFLFLDVGGNWHALMHAWDHSNDDAISGHLFSRDGLSWTASTTQPYGNTAALSDGTTLRIRTRERPKLMFDAAGNPTHLFNGINTNPSCPSPASSCKTRPGFDWDYTFVQPIVHA